MNAYLVNGSTNLLMKMKFGKNFLGRSTKIKLWVKHTGNQQIHTFDLVL